MKKGRRKTNSGRVSSLRKYSKASHQLRKSSSSRRRHLLQPPPTLKMSLINDSNLSSKKAETRSSLSSTKYLPFFFLLRHSPFLPARPQNNQLEKRQKDALRKVSEKDLLIKSQQEQIQDQLKVLSVGNGSRPQAQQSDLLDLL